MFIAALNSSRSVVSTPQPNGEDKLMTTRMFSALEAKDRAELNGFVLEQNFLAIYSDHVLYTFMYLTGFPKIDRICTNI